MKRLILTAALLFSTAASGHEYWLLPSSFSGKVGAPIGIEHRVGTGWPGETLPRDPRRIVRFTFVDARGERAIEGDPGADPAGTVTLRTPGIALAVYRSNPSRISLDATLFETYLRDEGLDAAVAFRTAHGESARPGEEMFSRNAKTMLVAAGQASAAGSARWRQPVGLTLELVPETDPRQLAGGGPFTVRLLYRGKPLEGALVKAFPQGSVVPDAKVRSDARGHATLVLAKPGVWLINAVHMVDAPPASGGARWESLWSSLTFELKP